jgi:hypothetical protein
MLAGLGIVVVFAAVVLWQMGALPAVWNMVVSVL